MGYDGDLDLLQSLTAPQQREISKRSFNPVAGAPRLPGLLEYSEGDLFTLWLPEVGSSAPFRGFALPWSAPSRTSASRKECPAAETASPSLSLGQEGRKEIHWNTWNYNPAVSWQMLTPGQLQWVSTDHSLWAPTDSPKCVSDGLLQQM